MPPTTRPKPDPDNPYADWTEAALREHAVQQDATIESERAMHQQAWDAVREVEWSFDDEAAMISRALAALKAERVGSRYSQDRPDYERILRYLAQRLDVHWPTPAGSDRPLDVMVNDTVLSGSVLHVDPDTGQVLGVTPPMPWR